MSASINPPIPQRNNSHILTGLPRNAVLKTSAVAVAISALITGIAVSHWLEIDVLNLLTSILERVYRHPGSFFIWIIWN
jgi:hypothetical protein